MADILDEFGEPIKYVPTPEVMLEFFAYQTVGCLLPYPVEEQRRHDGYLVEQLCERAVTKCLACGGELVDIRAKLQCKDCGRINESCCEGSRG